MTAPPALRNDDCSLQKTTVLFTGLATSFSKGEFAYVVSTIHRKEFGGFYQTSILKYPGGQMVYRVEVSSQLQSAQEHIDAVRMALSKPEGAWLGTKDYQDELMNKLLSNADSRTERPKEMSWRDENITALIAAANINYKPGLLSRLLS
jgi:hypothetical protein